MNKFLTLLVIILAFCQLSAAFIEATGSSSAANNSTSSSEKNTSSSEKNTSSSEKNASSASSSDPATVTWTCTNGNFSNKTCWSTGKLPSQSETVILNSTGSTITIDVATQVQSIELISVNLVITKATTAESISLDAASQIQIQSGVQVQADITSAGQISSTGATLNGDLSNSGNITLNGTQSTLTSLSTTNGIISLISGSAISSPSTTIQSGIFELNASQLNLSQSVIMNNGSLISQDSASTLNIDNAVITMTGSSSIASNSTTSITANVSMADGSSISFSSASVNFGMGAFDILDSAFIFTEDSSIVFSNNAISMSSEAYFKALASNISIDGYLIFQDSAQIYLDQQSSFDSGVSQFYFNGDSSLVIANSIYNSQNSQFQFTDTSFLHFTNTQLTSVNSTHQFSLDSIMVMKNINQSNLGSYSFSDNAQIQVNSGSVAQINDFSFTGLSQMIVDDSSSVTFLSDTVFANSSQLLVNHNSTIQFEGSSSVSFSGSNTSFSAAYNSLVTVDSQLYSYGSIDIQYATLTVTNNGVIYSYGPISINNATVNFESSTTGSTFSQVNFYLTTGFLNLASNNLTGVNANISFVDNGDEDVSSITLGFNTFTFSNSSIVFSVPVTQYSALTLDSSTVVTITDSYVISANIIGMGTVLNAGHVTINATDLKIQTTDFVNTAEFTMNGNEVFIGSFVQNSGDTLVVDAALSVNTFQSNSYVQVNDASIIGQQTIFIQGSTMQLNNGTLFGLVSLTARLLGNGVIVGHLIGDGYIGDQYSISAINVTGDLSLTSNSYITVLVQDAHTFTQIHVSGNATLDGKLLVVLGSPLNTVQYDSYSIKLFNFNGVKGNFSNVQFVLPAKDNFDACTYITTSESGVSVNFGCPHPNTINNSSAGDKTPSNKMKPGAVVAIIFAILAFLGLLAVVGFLVRRQIMKKKGIREPLLHRKELN